MSLAAFCLTHYLFPLSSLGLRHLPKPTKQRQETAQKSYVGGRGKVVFAHENTLNIAACVEVLDLRMSPQCCCSLQSFLFQCEHECICCATAILAQTTAIISEFHGEFKACVILSRHRKRVQEGRKFPGFRHKRKLTVLAQHWLR